MKWMLRILIFTMLFTAVSCTTQEALPPDEVIVTDAEMEDEPAVFFFTKDAGIVTLEMMDGFPYLSCPRLGIHLSPMDSFMSKDGSPWFRDGMNGINVKLYEDRALWMHWGRAEYTPWNFTYSPRDFYFYF